MNLQREITPSDFEAWQGGKDTMNEIIAAGKIDEFNCLVEEMISESKGITEEQFNDWLWFDRDFIFEHLGIAY